MSKPLKSGTKINISKGDVSFKGVIKRSSKTDDLQKIEIPAEWKDIIKGLEVGDECLLTCNEDQTFLQYKMIIMEKELSQLCPVLLLKPFKELKKRTELRKHKRIKAFIFTTLSKENNVDLEKKKETALNGTVSDISLGGCSLMSEQSFKINDKLWLIFELMDKETFINVQGMIRNLRKSHIEKCFYYGMEFIDLGTKEREAILSFAEEPGN